MLTPSDQRGDPIAWGGNQGTHALIGAATAGALVWLGPWVAFAATVAIWTAWELRHLVIGGKGKDGLRDLAFFAWGATYAFSGGAWWWPVIGMAAVIGGTWTRLNASPRQ
jgi:hypothetical protein